MVACVVDTRRRRPNAVYGHAGIKSLQLRRWRGYLTPAATVAGAIQWLSMMSVPVCFVQDVLLSWRRVRDGVPIQGLFQDAFLDMWETVAHAVGDLLDGVLRFEVCCPSSCKSMFSVLVS